MLVTPEQVQQYHNQGFCVLKNVISQAHLENLRAECGRYIDVMHEEMDRKGTDTLGISHRNSRYFISRRGMESAKLSSFLFSDLMAQVTQALLHEIRLAPRRWLCHGPRWRTPYPLSELLVSTG